MTQDAMEALVGPHPDGPDYCVDGKFFKYRIVLDLIRRDDRVPEEVKLRRLNHLRDEVIPFWLRCDELRASESKELMDIFLKYNGPEGIRKRYTEEYEEIISRIQATEDDVIIESMNQLRCDPDMGWSKQNFHYPPLGNIIYSLTLDQKDNPRTGLFRWNQDLREGHSGEIPKPFIRLVPFGPSDMIPHHHNMNPDDDLSLNTTLLEVLHRLMGHKDAEPLMDQVEDEELGSYADFIHKPRSLRFIEKALNSEPALGYGATAFFNDMYLVFLNCKVWNQRRSKYKKQCAINLENFMKELLQGLGGIGEQLLAQYNAIVKLGPEWWEDPDTVYLKYEFNPCLKYYEGRKPDIVAVRERAKQQFKWGQERVQKLRSRLALAASSAEQSSNKPVLEGEAHPDHEPRKRSREDSGEPDEHGQDRGPKRQRSLRSASPGLSDPESAPSRRAAGKRPRAPADDEGDDDNYEAGQSSAAKRQRLTKATASSSLSAISPEAVASGSQALPPPQASSKRARTPDGDQGDGDNQDNADSHGPSSSKRQRLMEDPNPVGLPATSSNAGPEHPGQANPEPAPQEPQFPTHYQVPSSQPLIFSRNTITMSKVAKMGKARPWVFGYNTEEGYGIYAFVKCPSQNCKHHFSSDPLRDNRARDHILSCNQPILDEQDMVRQYACQVVKDAGRKSDLTVDWARKSNLILLPSNQKDNHPDNFPLSPADE